MKKEQSTMQRKIGIYCRSATKEILEGTYSKQIESQRSRLVELVEQMNRTTPGWGTVIEIYIDDGVSALHMDRPALAKLREDIRAGTINAVLVTDSSRLSRSIQTYLSLCEEFSKANVQLIEAHKLASEGPQSSTASDRFAKLGDLFPSDFIRRQA